MAKDKSKSIEDLDTDKPEDIAAELARRAEGVSPREAPAEVENTEEEPESEPEGAESETPAEEPAEAEPESQDGLDLLSELRTRGVGDYKTVPEALEGLKNLRSRLSQREEDAVLGRHLMDLGIDPKDLQELVQRKSAPTRKGKSSDGWNPPHEYDPNWDETIRTVEDGDGKLEYEGPPDEIRKFKEYERYVKSKWRGITLDPKRIIPLIQDEIRNIAREELGRDRGESEYQEFMKENKEFIDGNRPDLQALLDDGMPPRAAVAHLRMKKELEELKGADKGASAKKADLKAAGRRTPRRGGARTSRVSEEDLSKLPTHKQLEILNAELDEPVPAEW